MQNDLPQANAVAITYIAPVMNSSRPKARSKVTMDNQIINETTERKIALGYIRESLSIDGGINHTGQWVHIYQTCKLYGFTLELYEEASFSTTRPALATLVQRLEDEDVIALVTYDLSRLDRRMNVASEILELAAKNVVAILFAEDLSHSISSA